MKQISFSIAALSESADSVKHIGIIVFDGVVLADVIGATDVFGMADKLISSIFAGEKGYSISLLSLRGGVVKSSNSVQIMTLALPPHDQHAFDTLLIASGTGNFDAYRDLGLIDWLRDGKHKIRRIAAVCSGVFVMAAAGLLDHRRATIHWALQDKLMHEFPSICVERDARITEDEGVFTVSDVGMGTDLALNFLENDLGSNVAKRVSENLAICQRRRAQTVLVRPVKQSENNISNKIQQASRWYVEHMAESINVYDAASFVFMSERNFQRQFKRETGWTPHEFLLHIRMEIAKQLLIKTDLPIDKIARRCGFLNGEHISKVFRKHLSTSPCEYRKNERPQDIQSLPFLDGQLITDQSEMFRPSL